MHQLWVLVRSYVACKPDTLLKPQLPLPLALKYLKNLPILGCHRTLNVPSGPTCVSPWLKFIYNPSNQPEPQSTGLSCPRGLQAVQGQEHETDSQDTLPSLFLPVKHLATLKSQFYFCDDGSKISTSVQAPGTTALIFHRPFLFEWQKWFLYFHQ